MKNKSWSVLKQRRHKFLGLNYQPLTFTGYWRTQNQNGALCGCCSSKKAIETLIGPAGGSKASKLSMKMNPKCQRNSPPLCFDTHFSTASYKNRVLITDTSVESMNFVIFSFSYSTLMLALSLLSRTWAVSATWTLQLVLGCECDLLGQVFAFWVLFWIFLLFLFPLLVCSLFSLKVPPQPFLFPPWHLPRTTW